MLRLRAFGGLSIEGGPWDRGGAARRRPLAMLALLAIGGQRGLSREKLASFLWQEADEERGRNSLSHALSALRRERPSEDLVVGTSELHLNSEAITSDVEEFQRCVAAGELERAVALYEGPFLDGFFINDAPEFERWVDEHRRRLHQMQGAALQRLAVQADRGDDRAAAVSWWRRLVALEPTSSQAALGLMTALAAAGDRPAAIQYYRMHQAVLRQELGVEPDEAIIALAARLRNAEPAVVDPNPDVLALTESRQFSSLGDRHSGANDALIQAPTIDPRQIRGASWRRTWRVRRRLLTYSAILATLAAFATLATVRATTPPDAREAVGTHRVVVARFDNETRDSAFDFLGDLLADWVTQGLQESGVVDVVDPVSAVLTARHLRAEGVTSTGSARAAALASAVGADLVVWGRIYRSRDSLYFSTRITDARGGSTLASLESVATGIQDGVGGAIHLRDRVAGALASMLDERVATVISHQAPPPNIDAYREYVTGLERLVGPGATGIGLKEKRAASHFESAARLDSSFSLSLIWAAFSLSEIGDLTERDSVIRVLAERVESLSPLERHGLEFYQSHSRRDFAGMKAAAENAARLSPGSQWSYEAANLALARNRPREALRFFRQIDPEHSWAQSFFPYWKGLTTSLHLLGDSRAELAAAQQYYTRYPEMPQSQNLLIRALIAARKYDESERHVGEMLKKPGNIGGGAKAIAQEFQAHGEWDRATGVLNTAITWSHSPAAERVVAAAGQDSAAVRAEIRLREGVLLYTAGRYRESREIFERFAPVGNPASAQSNLESSTPPAWPICHHCGWSAASVQIYLSLIAAHLGNRAEAERIVRTLEAVPVDSLDSADRYYTIMVAAALGDSARAVKDLSELLRDNTVADILMYVHRERDWFGLRSYRPFQALMRPKE